LVFDPIRFDPIRPTSDRIAEIDLIPWGKRETGTIQIKNREFVSRVFSDHLRDTLT